MSRERGMVVEYDKKLKKNSLKTSVKLIQPNFLLVFNAPFNNVLKCLFVHTYCMHYAAILLYTGVCVPKAVILLAWSFMSSTSSPLC